MRDINDDLYLMISLVVNKEHESLSFTNTEDG